jgi:hypothetical protein
MVVKICIERETPTHDFVNFSPFLKENAIEMPTKIPDNAAFIQKPLF